MTTASVAPEVLHVWALCLRAGEEARRRGDRRAGTDHLLLALFEGDPSIGAVLGADRQRACQALDSLDRDALDALGLESGIDAPPVPMRAVPNRPRLRDVAGKDRLRITPAAKRVLEEASRPNRRKTQVTVRQVLAQLLTLQSPDHAAVLLDSLGVDRSEVRRRLGSPGRA